MSALKNDPKLDHPVLRAGDPEFERQRELMNHFVTIYRLKWSELPTPFELWLGAVATLRPKPISKEEIEKLAEVAGADAHAFAQALLSAVFPHFALVEDNPTD